MNICDIVTKGKLPARIIYKNEKNLYKARKPLTWRDVIKKVKNMSGFCCVTDMIQHIYD